MSARATTGPGRILSLYCVLGGLVRIWLVKFNPPLSFTVPGPSYDSTSKPALCEHSVLRTAQ